MGKFSFLRQVDYLVCINPLSRAYTSTLWYTQKTEFAIRPIPASEVCNEKTAGGFGLSSAQKDHQVALASTWLCMNSKSCLSPCDAGI